MRTSRDTKRMFADELEEMMAAMPLSKVRVADLCARCGVERRVFYYHFKDKYDLVAWIFESDYLLAADRYAPYSEELFTDAHRRLWARRGFYRRAFEEDSQNSIRRYLSQFSVESNETLLKRYLGVRELSGEMALQARHFAYGNIGCLIEWLCGDLEATPTQLSSYMFACIPSTLRKAYGR